MCKQTKKKVKISVEILTLHDIPVCVRLQESITTNKKVELNKTNDRTKQKKITQNHKQTDVLIYFSARAARSAAYFDVCVRAKTETEMSNK